MTGSYIFRFGKTDLAHVLIINVRLSWNEATSIVLWMAQRYSFITDNAAKEVCNEQ